MSKKKIIISLCALVTALLAFIATYFLLLPLLENDTPENKPPETIEGEGLYLDTRITIYPEIKESDIVSIKVTNKDGSYTFHKVWDKALGRYALKIAEYEGNSFDEKSFAYLKAYARLTMSADNEPIRNATKEEMEEYGVTRETCEAEFTITYTNSENKEGSYTVFVGHKTFTDEDTYYTALEGRNSVYRFQENADVLFMSLKEYLTPVVYQKFPNEKDALDGIIEFVIKKGDKYVVELSKDEKMSNEIASIFNLKYHHSTAGRVLMGRAGSDYVQTAFGALYVSLEGESVVAINPDIETLKQYGLGPDDTKFEVSCAFSKKDGDYYQMLISDEIDGYYYTLSTIYNAEKPFLVKIPKETLSFLTDDPRVCLSWVDTMMSGFFEYLVTDSENDVPGIAQVIISTSNDTESLSETFKIEDDKSTDSIKATGLLSGKEFKTYYISAKEKINQFSNYYSLLIYFPTPARFNSMTEEEIAPYKTEDNKVFELITRNKNDELLRYTYYQISGSYAMMETCKGKLDNSGNEVWEKPLVSFDVNMTQITILRDNFKKLMNGEEVRPEDYIY